MPQKINTRHHAFPQSSIQVGNLCITHHCADSFNEIFGRIQSQRNNIPILFLQDTHFSVRQSTRMYSGWHVGGKMGYQCNVGAEFNITDIVVLSANSNWVHLTKKKWEQRNQVETWIRLCSSLLSCQMTNLQLFTPIGSGGNKKNIVPWDLYGRNSTESTVDPNTTTSQSSPPWWCRLPLLQHGIYGSARSDADNLFQRVWARVHTMGLR